MRLLLILFLLTGSHAFYDYETPGQNDYEASQSDYEVSQTDYDFMQQPVNDDNLIDSTTKQPIDDLNHSQDRAMITILNGWSAQDVGRADQEPEDIAEPDAEQLPSDAEQPPPDAEQTPPDADQPLHDADQFLTDAEQPLDAEQAVADVGVNMTARLLKKKMKHLAYKLEQRELRRCKFLKF